MNDYRRPAEYQITKHYVCAKCGDEQTVEGGFSAHMPCYRCGGFVVYSGESHPADSADWHEERDNVNDQFRNPYQDRY